MTFKKAYEQVRTLYMSANTDKLSNQSLTVLCKKSIFLSNQTNQYSLASFDFFPQSLADSEG